MARAHQLHFRVTEMQYERLKSNAQSEGHLSLASYLRYLALERDKLIDEKIIETSKRVKDMHEILSKAKLRTAKL